MLYVIIASDVANSLEMRQKHRPEHLKRLHKLRDEGRLIAAGPNPIIDAADTSAGCSGSIIIAEFASLDKAQTWAQNDPFMLNGVYQNISVKPFIKALP